VFVSNTNYNCRQSIDEAQCSANIECDTGNDFFDVGTRTVTPYIEKITLHCDGKKPIEQASFSHGGELWMSIECRRNP
jgi:hypothetical protein